MENNKKNVLIVAYNDLGVGGVQYVISQVVKLSAEGYKFDIVVFKNSDIYYEEFIQNKIKIIQLQFPKKKSLISRILWNIKGKELFLYKSFDELMNRKKYDIVHSFRELDSYPIFKAAIKHKIKKRILHINSMHFPPNSFLHRGIWKRQKKLTIKHSSHLIFVSDQARKQLLGNKYSKKKFSVIYNPYNSQKYNFDTSNIYTDKITLVHVASLSRNKNQLFSIKIFEELVKIHPQSTLYIIGDEKQSKYKNILSNYIEDNKITQIYFHTSTFDVTTIKNQIFCYILPSIQEAAPLVTIEAQAQGIRVFTSNAVSNELNCGGLTRLSIDNAEKWAKTINKCFAKDKGKRFIYDLDKFSFKTFKNKIIEFYE